MEEQTITKRYYPAIKLMDNNRLQQPALQDMERTKDDSGAKEPR
jgi:hypothetical protein